MKRVFAFVSILVFLLVALLACTSKFPAAPDPPQVNLEEEQRIVAEVMVDGALAGGGVLLSPDGYVVTCNHVIKEADTITLVMLDWPKGTVELAAELVYAVPEADVAVLRILCLSEPKYARVAVWGDSDTLRTGEAVYLIGHPYGETWTISRGIVSCRRMDPPGYEQIQSDALTGPGASGGALLNSRGQLIGLNQSAYCFQFYGMRMSAGIGYAINGNMVRCIAEAIIQVDRQRRTVLERYGG